MKVYITRPILEAAAKELRENNIEVIIGPEGGSDYSELTNQVKECDGMISMLSDKIDQELLSQSSHLKVISNYAVGFDNIDVEFASRKNIKIGNTPGVLTEATAELALALLMSVQRQVKASEKYIQNNQWKTWHPTDLLGHNLGSRKIGIVGMGRIGFHFAKMCYHAFGSEIYYAHTRENEQANQDLKAKKLTLEELFKTCDIVSLHCPFNDSTNGMVNLDLLKQTPKDFILINTARGAVVKTDDLLQALNENIIWGAGLDVTEPEPLDPKHELYQHDRCIILPHLGSATEEARNAMALRAAQNIIAGLKGEPLPFAVN